LLQLRGGTAEQDHAVVGSKGAGAVEHRDRRFTRFQRYARERVGDKGVARSEASSRGERFEGYARALTFARCEAEKLLNPGIIRKPASGVAGQREQDFGAPATDQVQSAIDHCLCIARTESTHNSLGVRA
jgi:hypothetical protein